MTAISLIIWCHLPVPLKFTLDFSLHTLFHVGVFQGSGPVLFTLCSISSTHGFTYSLFSGNFQIHFCSLHFSPKLQIPKAPGEVPQTKHVQTDLISSNQIWKPTKSSRQLPSPAASTGSGVVDIFSQAKTRWAKNIVLF